MTADLACREYGNAAHTVITEHDAADGDLGQGSHESALGCANTDECRVGHFTAARQFANHRAKKRSEANADKCADDWDGDEGEEDPPDQSSNQRAPGAAPGPPRTVERRSRKTQARRLLPSQPEQAVLQASFKPRKFPCVTQAYAPSRGQHEPQAGQRHHREREAGEEEQEENDVVENGHWIKLESRNSNDESNSKFELGNDETGRLGWSKALLIPPHPALSRGERGKRALGICFVIRYSIIRH